MLLLLARTMRYKRLPVAFLISIIVITGTLLLSTPARADSSNTICSNMGGSDAADYFWTDSHGNHDLQACSGSGTSSYGTAFQCEELVQRYANMRWGDPAPAPSWTAGTGWGVNADRVWTVHPSHLAAISNGANSAPAPGDIIVYGPLDPNTNAVPTSPNASIFNSQDGHIAIVTSTSSSYGGHPTITLIEQNPADIQQQYYVAVNGSSYTIENDVRYGVYGDSRAKTNGYWTTGMDKNGNPLTGLVIYGWLHDPNNGGGGGGGTPSSLAVFTNGSNQQLYQNSLSNVSWTGWTSLGGVWPATSQPAVVAKTQNWLDVFQVGGDHALYHQWWNGSTWSSGWQNLGGIWPATSQPVVISKAPGNIDVFIVGPDQALYQDSLSGATWSGWTNLGGVWPATSQPVAVSKTQNWIDVFLVGGDHALYHQWWNGSTWSSGWQNLGGIWPATSQPVVISKAPGNIDVFIVGPDQALYQDSLSGATWSGWTNLGGVWPATSQPAVVAKTQNWIDVFLVGGDHALYHQWWNGSTWSSGWQNLGGIWPATSQVSAVAKTQNWIDVFIVGSDQMLYHNWLDTSNAWYGWQNLAGVWPSTSQPVAIVY